MKTLLGLLIIILGYCSLPAQHCPFDYMAILVLEVRDAKTNEKIPNLYISLRDDQDKALIKGKSRSELCSKSIFHK